MRRWVSELGIGAQAGFGSPTARLRTTLTALGVALGVCVLLVAASVPHAVAVRQAREQAATPMPSSPRGREIVMQQSTIFHGMAIGETDVQVLRGHAARRPPGVARLPGPGEMIVSPRVADLLHGPGGGELRRRLRARVIGTIGPAGLTGPDEALLYRGSDMLAAADQQPVAGFGGPVGGGTVLPLITLLTIVVVVALLLPVAVFVATAARFGAEERDRRLAAIRLVGADLPTTMRIAAGESLLAAVVGLLLGVGGFLLARPLAAHAGVVGAAVYPRDLSPSPWLAALVGVLVPCSAIGATLVSIRRVAVEPLGVSRRAARRRRRLAWRVAAPVLGFALLVPLATGTGRLSSATGQADAATGVILVLLGVTALLPWAVETVVRRAGDGPLPWLLAVRRLRHEEGTTGRVIGGIGLAVAGAIALSVVFSAAQASVGSRLTPREARMVVVQLNAWTRPGARHDAAALETVPGVHARVLDVSRQGRMFVASVAALEDPGHRAAALARLQDRAAALDPLAEVIPATGGDRETTALRALQRALLAGALVVLGMIGASLLIATGEGLRERRPALAVLSAVGTRRTTVACALLWQSAIPVLGGLTIALALGIALGAMLSATVGLHPVYDWGGVALMVAAGFAVTAAVTGLALPTLGRAMRPQELRTE